LKKITIFASGSGSNAERIMDYFADSSEVEINLIVTNKPDAGVIQRAKSYHVPTKVINSKRELSDPQFSSFLKDTGTDLIVLAGFLLLIPEELVNSFPNKIVNIHPALLPKYGGKGMYGINVHRAVLQNQEKESGMTIHFVNKKYDEGEIIFQARCALSPEDTAEIIAKKVLRMEHMYLAPICEQVLLAE